MDEIPFYIRESIQKIIDKKVQERVNEEMAQFKEVIRQELADQKVQNQVQIGHHTYAGRPGTGWYGRHHHPYYHHPYHHRGYPYHHHPYHHPYYHGDLRDPAYYGPYRHVSPIRMYKNGAEQKPEWKK